MDVHLLGPVEVLVEGKSLGLGGTKQRALLAMLALEAGRTVSADRLIAGLWGDETPASAQKMVQQYVSQLRRLLAADAAEIVTRGRGYELRLAGGSTDVARFEALLGNTPARPREAMRLWRGTPLADVADEPFAPTEIRRLEELRLRALELAIDQDLAAGRHSEVLSEIDALVAENPLSEKLHARRMLALYRAGRQAMALQAYRDARAVLVGEVGIEPGPELRALHERILRQDPALELAPVPAVTPVPARASGAARRSRRRATAAGMAVLLAGFAILGIARGEDEGAARIGADAVGRMAGDGAIAARFAVGRNPGAIVAGGGSIWVASERDRTVTRIDGARDRVVTIDVGAEPVGLAYGGGSLWVADGSAGRVVRVDPASDRVVQRIELSNVPRAITAGHGSVWVASAVGGAITQIDLERGRVLPVSRVGGSPTALAAGAGSLWIASESEGAVMKVDPRTGVVVRTVAVGGAPAAIAVGDGGVWVANRYDDTVSRIDAERGTVTETLRVGRAPVAVAAADAAVWVANSQDATLSRIDPRTRRVTRTVDVGGGPAGVAFGDGALWVSAAGDVAAHRGGTLRFSGIGETDDWVLDPASPESDGMFGQALLPLLYDGLVAYRRVGGVAGAQIVADLAEAVPHPSDDGRTYAFRIRRGLRYADGEPVRASDFRASMERGLRLHEGGREAYASVPGAAACGGPRCDLSAGVETDDVAGTIVLRLRRPDPELLHKLAQPFASLRPGGGAVERGGAPAPGTGPYRVESLSREGGGRLVRNPHFRSWSQDARPPAFADEILLEPGGPDGADVRLGLVPQSPSELRVLATRHGGRLHADPTLMSQWLVLNTRRPPFDDVRVRRAVNLAIDRQRVIELVGGDEAGEITCRILPLGLAGHRPVCPFTRDAVGPPAGGWRGPDLERARRLIETSGTRGMRIDVATADMFGLLGPYVRDLMRDLGYRTSLRVFPSTETYFGALAGGTAHAGPVVWFGDTLASSSFLEANFSCDHPLNFSRLCDLRLDALIDRAYRTRDPSSADVRWDRVERRLATLAPVVPLLHGRRLTILSDRAGNVQNHPLWGPLLDQVWVR